jgi:hypothetical protein
MHSAEVCPMPYAIWQFFQTYFNFCRGLSLENLHVEKQFLFLLFHYYLSCKFAANLKKCGDNYTRRELKG